MKALEKIKNSITLKKAGDDLLGATLVGTGLVGTSYGMKLLSAKVNPWVLSGSATLAGFLIRVGANVLDDGAVKNSVKDLGTGIMVAGAIDGSVKVLKYFNILPAVQAAAPQLSGGQPRKMVYRGIRGPVNSTLLNGDANAPIQEAKVISSTLLD
jgi:hypothetical protein